MEVGAGCIQAVHGGSDTRTHAEKGIKSLSPATEKGNLYRARLFSCRMAVSNRDPDVIDCRKG